MSANTTEAIDGLTAAATNMTATFDALVAAMLLLVSALEITRFFEIALLLGFLAIALGQKDWMDKMILLFVSGLITALIGARWADDYIGVTVILWGLATYELLKAVLLALEASGPAKGWGQFKGLYHKVRGRGE